MGNTRRGRSVGPDQHGDLFVDDSGVVRWVSLEKQRQLKGEGVYHGSADGYAVLVANGLDLAIGD